MKSLLRECALLSLQWNRPSCDATRHHPYLEQTMRLLTALAALFLVAVAAHAHEVRPTIATLYIESDRSVVLTLDTNAEALLAEIGPEHEDTDNAPNAQLYDDLRALPAAELQERLRDFVPRYVAEGLVTAQGEPVPLRLDTITVPPVGDISLPRATLLSLSGTLPEATPTFGWSFPATYGASVLRIERPGQEIDGRFFAAGDSAADLPVGIAEQRAWWQTAIDYIIAGFDHILPKGLDHILFVLGLFFLSPRLKPLVWQVSAFTLAHTVTLAMGLYGVLNISPSIVEPLIALSIVYVAVENIVTKELHPWRPLIVFLFGLLHGLGFAGVLAEFGLPEGQVPLALISFNVGVELGQLTVIAIAFVLVGWAFNKAWYRKGIAIPASLGIGLMGAYWFLERTVL
ncbi:MAG: HupE/UreJ family protein [Pseudomonadota bacterium]